jgi:hypothetical protein
MEKMSGVAASRYCGLVFACFMVAMPIIARPALAAKLAGAEKHMLLFRLDLPTNYQTIYRS